MTATPDLSGLKALLGETGWSDDESELAPHLTEWRGRWKGATPLLVKPRSVDEVAKIVGWCAAHRIAITPQGGNTGLVGGQIPQGEVLLSLTRLNRIREVSPADDTLVIEAGATLSAAHAAAAGAGRTFPLSLASEGTATIGGLISTNAGGVAVLRYGVMRDLVLGVEAVLPDGSVFSGLKRLRKDNTGYDLKQLLIGAEGTLGVVTAAALKLFPKPRSRATAFVGVPTPEAALSLFRLARERLGASVVSFELIPRIALDFVLRHQHGARDPLEGRHDWYVLVEAASQVSSGLDDALTEMLGEAVERELVEDATLAATLDQRNAFWLLRESISDMQKYEGGSIKHDVSVPIASVPAFIAEATTAVEAFLPGARVVPFGHMGDGNIHFNVSQPVGADKDAYLERWESMNQVVHAIVARMHGSVSAEHGIGVLKRELLAQTKDAVALDVMRKVKAALDPMGLLNPGKVL